MPKLDLDAIPQTNATGYPSPFDALVEGRWYRRLAPAAGLTLMGATHVTLVPGGYSSQRHWHRGQDEIVVMVSGEAVLIDDTGETPVSAGDVLTFPAGEANGHHLHNRSGEREPQFRGGDVLCHNDRPCESTSDRSSPSAPTSTPTSRPSTTWRRAAGSPTRS